MQVISHKVYTCIFETKYAKLVITSGVLAWVTLVFLKKQLDIPYVYHHKTVEEISKLSFKQSFVGDLAKISGYIQLVLSLHFECFLTNLPCFVMFNRLFILCF